MLHTTYSCDAGPLHTIRLWRDEGQTESDDEILREQLAAQADFARGWIAALSVSLKVACSDPTTGSTFETARPERPTWKITVRGVSDDVLLPPLDPGDEELHVDVIDEHSLRAFATRATAESGCQNGYAAVVTDAAWTAVRVRIPVEDATQLAVEDRRGLIATLTVERFEDACWIAAPTHRLPGDPPLSIMLSEGTLRVDLFWDLWLTEAGRRVWEDGVARVLARGTGWYVVPTDGDAIR